MKNRQVSIIIPAYNEENKIENTLKYLKFDWLKEIIIVNDGSRDNTLEIIKRYPVEIINFKKNKGKGKAVAAGLKKARGQIIGLIDADLGESIIEINKIVKPVLKRKADITIAVLSIKGGGIGLVRHLAQKGVEVLTGVTLHAPLSGQRIFKRKIIDDILPLTDGFGLETGMNIDLIRNGYNIKEIKCNFNHNITKKDIKGFYHRSQQFMDIFKALWEKRKRGQ